jgi:hypothetical protein
MEVKPDLRQVLTQLVEEMKDHKRQLELLSCDEVSTVEQQPCPCRHDRQAKTAKMIALYGPVSLI